MRKAISFQQLQRPRLRCPNTQKAVEAKGLEVALASHLCYMGAPTPAFPSSLPRLCWRPFFPLSSDWHSKASWPLFLWAPTQQLAGAKESTQLRPQVQACRGSLRRLTCSFSLPGWASACPCDSLAMDSWLILFSALAMAVPTQDGVRELGSEAPAATGPSWPLCPPEGTSSLPGSPQEGDLPVPRFSSCMLRCAYRVYQSYGALLATGGIKSTLSLKLNEGGSRQGEEHEFCWMLRLRCQKDVRLTKAFVLLNLEQALDQSRPFPYHLILTAPPSLRRSLRPSSGSHHHARMLSGEACGVRFDVTEPFRRAEGGQDAEMCIKAVCLEEDCQGLQVGLSCPPFLATLWRTLPRPDG